MTLQEIVSDNDKKRKVADKDESKYHAPVECERETTIDEIIESAVNVATSVVSTKDHTLLLPPPTVNKRGRRPAGDKHKGKEIVKGRLSPLDIYLLENIDSSAVAEFDEWIQKGRLKHSKSNKVYHDHDNNLNPAFYFSIADVTDKEWFYTLITLGQPISSSHVDVMFYYLRKKNKYDESIKIKYTMIDNFFDQKLQLVYRIFEKEKDASVLGDEMVIMEYMLGHYMYCNTLWSDVDYIIFLINVVAAFHWILGCISIHEGCIYVYNFLRTPTVDAASMEAVRAYSTILLFYLEIIKFYEPKVDRKDRPEKESFKGQVVDNLPEQDKCDCEMFMFYFAECFATRKEISPVFDVVSYKKRVDVNLYLHGRMKHNEGTKSDDEKSG